MMLLVEAMWILLALFVVRYMSRAAGMFMLGAATGFALAVAVAGGTLERLIN